MWINRDSVQRNQNAEGLMEKQDNNPNSNTYSANSKRKRQFLWLSVVRKLSNFGKYAFLTDGFNNWKIKRQTLIEKNRKEKQD